MLGVFAEFEHATIVDRISAGIERRARESRWFGGRPPFGYTSSSEQRLLVPDPVKAPVVRRIFDLYTRERVGTIAIAERLREEGAPAPSAGWGHPAVHWILTNPTYTGRIRWRDKVFDACTSRSSTSSPSHAPRGSCASAARTSPAGAATQATSSSPASSDAGGAGALTSA